jgi:hypothetical protein
MWDESRATLGIQYSWAQITLYGDDEFFNILLRVIIHRIGDDRKVFSTKFSIRCETDDNGQAAVEQYFAKLKKYFQANNTTEVVRCKMLIAELYETTVHGWIWQMVFYRS